MVSRRTQEELVRSWPEGVGPEVSICCITYNQERYIADALDSFLEQETTFPIEIIVRDDCSSDATTDIVRSYVDRYPLIVKPVYEEKNQYSLGVKPNSVVTRMAQGRYIALCEGDDYWTDRSKLQFQYDFMESHPDVSLLFQNAEVHEHDQGGALRARRPFNTGIRSGAIKPAALVADWIVPTATVIFRNRDLTEFYRRISGFPVGDTPLFLYLAKFGTVHYQDVTQSVYRILESGIYRSRLPALESARSFVRYYNELEEMFPEHGLEKAVRKQRSIHQAWIIRLLVGQEGVIEALRYSSRLAAQSPLGFLCMMQVVSGRLLKKLTT